MLPVQNKTVRIKKKQLQLLNNKLFEMVFDHEIKENTLIIRLSGDLIGENNGANVLDVVSSAIQENVRKCIVDIASLRYINSSGIGVLITILTKFRNKGGEVYLLKPSESVQKLLVITKLNAIFQIIQTEEEALQLAKK
jgi:anti-sigma B factor antagonist